MVASLAAPDSWQVLLDNRFICGQVLWLIEKPPVILMWKLYFKFLGFLKLTKLCQTASKHSWPLMLVLVGSRTQFSTSEPSSLAGSWDNDTQGGCQAGRQSRLTSRRKTQKQSSRWQVLQECQAQRPRCQLCGTACYSCCRGGPSDFPIIFSTSLSILWIIQYGSKL